MNVQIEESWKTHLQPEFEKDYFRTLTEFVKSEYSQYGAQYKMWHGQNVGRST